MTQEQPFEIPAWLRRPLHCAYCKAGLDRTAETGGVTFIHILTRDADGRILKSRPCTAP